MIILGLMGAFILGVPMGMVLSIRWFQGGRCDQCLNCRTARKHYPCEKPGI